MQLEEEYDEKHKVLKEKRELESKLLTAEDKVPLLSIRCGTDHSAVLKVVKSI